MKRFNRILAALLAALMLCGACTTVAEMELELELKPLENNAEIELEIDPENVEGELGGIMELPGDLEIDGVGLDDLDAEITVDGNLLPGGTEAEGTGTISSNSFTDGDYNDYEFKIDSTGRLYEYNGDGGNVVIPDGVTSIGEGVFRYKAVTSVSIPSSVTSIGEEAFMMSDLTSLTIPNSVTIILKDAFSYTDITSIVIPESITYIGEWFSGCDELTNVTIHNNVTRISEHAFCLCDRLDSITIPSSVSYIGHAAFWDCGLSTVIIHAKKIFIDDEAFMQSHPTFYTYYDSDVYKWAQNRKYDVVDISEGALSETSLAMEYGDTCSLTVYAPEGCAATWSSSDDTVATVKDGTVTAIAEGHCTVTATLSNGKSLTCDVTVTDPADLYEYDKDSEDWYYHYDSESEYYLKECTPITSTSLSIGETLKLLVTYKADRTVVWSSSNPSVATVNHGKVTPIKEGSCTITATLSNGKALMCNVTVYDDAELSKTQLSLKVGSNAKLTVYGLGGRTVAWSSSAKNIATVKEGIVTAIKAGTCTIIAKVKNGKTLKCKVTVKDPAKLSKTNLSMNTGETRTLTISGLANRKVTWSTSNKKVATVKNGKITAVYMGKCTITAKIKNGKTLKCTVTVTDGAKLSSDKLTISSIDSATIKLTGATKRKVTWSTSNANIVKITKSNADSATIKAVKNGTATITAKLDGGKTLKCVVTVVNPLTIKEDWDDDFDDLAHWEVGVKITNNSNKKIIYVTFDILQYDNRGVKLQSPYDYYYFNDDIEPHDYWYRRYTVNDDTRSVKFKIREVTFADKTTWKP